MLHQSQEIIRFCIIAYPCFFITMAGFDLMLRIAGEFVRTSAKTQTRQAVEPEPLSELQPVPPTCPELKSPQPATETPLSQLKRYKLHGHEVVPVNQLSIPLPATIKRYKLRGEPVVRLSDIA